MYTPYAKELLKKVCEMREYVDTSLYLSDSTAMEALSLGKIKIDWGKLLRGLRDHVIRVYKVILSWASAMIQRMTGNSDELLHKEGYDYCTQFMVDHADDINLTKVIIRFSTLVQSIEKEWKSNFINREPSAISNLIEQVEGYAAGLPEITKTATNALNEVRNIVRRHHDMSQYASAKQVAIGTGDLMMKFLDMFSKNEKAMLAILDMIGATQKSYAQKVSSERGQVDDIWGPVMQVLYAETETASKLLATTATVSSAMNLMVEACTYGAKRGVNDLVSFSDDQVKF